MPDKPSEVLNRNWSPLGPLMERVLSGLGLSREVAEWKTLHRWPEVAGKKMAARVRAVRVQDGVLWVQSGPQWAAEVSARKSELLDKLNAGDAILNDIRFVGAWEGGSGRGRQAG